MIAELGSGSGQKTRWLLEELAHRQPVHYYPIDISAAALARCRQELSQIECVSILGFERAYLDGLIEVAARRRPGEYLLVLFLGGTIGNFARPAAESFLGQCARTAGRVMPCSSPPIWKNRSRNSCWPTTILPA